MSIYYRRDICSEKALGFSRPIFYFICIIVHHHGVFDMNSVARLFGAQSAGLSDIELAATLYHQRLQH